MKIWGSWFNKTNQRMTVLLVTIPLLALRWLSVRLIDLKKMVL